jgi:hypothetical protein
MDCFGIRLDLKKKVQTLVDGGMAEPLATRQVLEEEYKSVHGELNDLRKKLGLDEQPYVPFEELNMEEINSLIPEPVSKQETTTSDTSPTITSDISDVETKQQIENFGVPKEDVESVHGVISQVFNGLKKAGLTVAKTVGDWVAIGKGTERPYSLKINGKDVQVKNVQPEVVNGFYSPQHSIDITPELKASVEGGQPLFKGVGDYVETSGYRSQMTEDDKGNYLFFHYSNKKFNQLNPGTVGVHLATSREEKTKIGVSSLYTRPDILEPQVPSDYGYIIRIPKKNVYTFNTDPLNLLEKAKERFEKESKDIAFDLNNQLAYVAKLAAENGFPVTIAEWNIKSSKTLIAKTTEKLGVEKYTNIKPGTLNQTEYAKGTENIKPNAKRRDIPSLFKDNVAQYRIESGKNIVEAIKDFDGSPEATVALTHEIMHPTVVAIIDGAKDGNEVGVKHTKTIVSEFNKANPKNQVTVDELIAGNEEFKVGTTSEQYRAVQEFIAQSWEKYHTEGGKGFSANFQKVLEQITEAFKAVYKSLSGRQLTPELRKMFDEILGKEFISTQEQNLSQKDTKSVTENPTNEQQSETDNTQTQNVDPENIFEQLNNASIDEAREILDLEKLESSKRTVEDIVKEAHQKYITQSVLNEGHYVRETYIINKVNKGHVINASEQYALGNLIHKLMKERRNLNKMIAEAQSKKIFHSDFVDSMTEINDLLDNATKALRVAGGDAGRNLAIRKELLKFDAYSFENLKYEMEVKMKKLGASITGSDLNALETASAKIELKQDDVEVKRSEEVKIIKRNKEIAANNAMAEINKRKNHLKSASKLSESLSKLDNILKGNNC